MPVNELALIKANKGRIAADLLRVGTVEVGDVCTVKYTFTIVDENGNEVLQGTIDVKDDLSDEQKNCLKQTLHSIREKAETSYNLIHRDKQPT